MECLIREYKKEDAYAVAHVVTVAWNETYKSIVPDCFLEELKNNEKERGTSAYNEFDVCKDKELVLEVNGEIVGFVKYGEASGNDFNNCGEIIALYIMKKYQGYGFGRKLVDMAKDDLRKQGFDKMIIACLKGNPTNNFYKHIGGKYVKDGVFEKLNLKENVYLYDITK